MPNDNVTTATVIRARDWADKAVSAYRTARSYEDVSMFATFAHMESAVATADALTRIADAVERIAADEAAVKRFIDTDIFGGGAPV